MYYFIKCLKQYADFKGRARRKEFWFFQLFVLLIMLVVGLGAAFAGVSEESSDMLMNVMVLAFFLPALAVMVRRLHDIDRSGWWALLNLIPLANLVLLVFACFEGTRGSNRFGPDPKQQEGLVE
ncbi:DUF805 domain-containing protein [Uruburuella testudinis]|uniref:DUF805 domain-containing protein n=1 Tax=Uruburuella testudinis TaxID=1282863 RepID=A0ABY4E0A6_9NEIS|nr:DUF805 domain-containing protein [Uruburuella testudinis]UOO82401.1 DUF805 domain-containing protein [Uruburuella testudinis]